MAVAVSIKHSATGEIRSTVVGFSWTSLLFSFFVPLLRGDFWYAVGMFLLEIIAVYFTAGIGSILVRLYIAFTYNKRWIQKLSEKGFMPSDESNVYTMKAHGISFEVKKFEVKR